MQGTRTREPKPGGWGRCEAVAVPFRGAGAVSEPCHSGKGNIGAQIITNIILRVPYYM